MKDPSDLPIKDVHLFVCMNLVNGHVRNAKVMTVAHAELLNSHNHTQESGYKWLWDDQFNFNDKLIDDASLVPPG